MDQEYKKYINQPISLWPNFEIKWNTDTKKTLEYSKNDFGELNDDDFVVILVNFKDLYKNLSSVHRRWTRKRFWSYFGNQNKIAFIIDMLNKGVEAYPPILDLDIEKYGDCIVVRDGNHRLGVCFAKEIEILPILVPKNHANQIIRKIEQAS